MGSRLRGRSPDVSCWTPPPSPTPNWGWRNLDEASRRLGRCAPSAPRGACSVAATCTAGLGPCGTLSPDARRRSAAEPVRLWGPESAARAAAASCSRRPDPALPVSHTGDRGVHTNEG
eukprot:2561173-Prymnesium_polylepis.1